MGLHFWFANLGIAQASVLIRQAIYLCLSSISFRSMAVVNVD